MTDKQDTPEETFEKIKPFIESYVTERILMFYEHAVDCGGMQRMIAPPVVSNNKPPELKIIK